MTSFPTFLRLFVQAAVKNASHRFVYIIKRKLRGGLKIGVLFSRVRDRSFFMSMGGLVGFG